MSDDLIRQYDAVRIASEHEDALAKLGRSAEAYAAVCIMRSLRALPTMNERPQVDDDSDTISVPLCWRLVAAVEPDGDRRRVREMWIEDHAGRRLTALDGLVLQIAKARAYRIEETAGRTIEPGEE